MLGGQSVYKTGTEPVLKPLMEDQDKETNEQTKKSVKSDITRTVRQLAHY